MATRVHCDKCDEVLPTRDINRDLIEIETKNSDGEIFIFRLWLRGVAFKKSDVRNVHEHFHVTLCQKCLSDFALRYSTMIKKEEGNE